MSEPACLRRQRTAVERAQQLLVHLGFYPTQTGGGPFHLIAVKGRQFKYIRIVLDRIEPYDRERVGDWAPGSKISREIWFRKRGRHNFKRILIPSRK